MMPATSWLSALTYAMFIVCCASALVNSQNAATSTPGIAASTPLLTANSLKFSVANVMQVTPTQTVKEAPLKRNTKATDSSRAASASIYEAPPEFYRGPGSISSSTSPYVAAVNNYTSLPALTSSLRSAFLSPQIAQNSSATTNVRSNFDGSNISGIKLQTKLNNWRTLRGAATGDGSPGYNDRISVGHYGSVNDGKEQDERTYYSSGYDGIVRPHHQIESHSQHDYVEAQHYPPSGHGANNAGSYYYDGEGLAGGAINFDVYGHRGYGSGNDYSYTYPKVHEAVGHKGHPELSPKALLAKSFLIPLASAAVLGIAAALVSNPLLLQLGTVSAVGLPAVVGKRKRRDLASKQRPVAHSLAYHGQHTAFSTWQDETGKSNKILLLKPN